MPAFARKEKEAAMKLNIGMVSTRFAGLDGINLEAAKWADCSKRAVHFHSNAAEPCAYR